MFEISCCVSVFVGQASKNAKIKNVIHRTAETKGFTERLC